MLDRYARFYFLNLLCWTMNFTLEFLEMLLMNQKQIVKEDHSFIYGVILLLNQIYTFSSVILFKY